MRLRTLPAFLLPVLVCTGAVYAQVPVWTAQYNNSRTGANLSETVLNHRNVNVNSFGKLITWPVDGWIFAQPLYIPRVQINGTMHNVVYIATMSNTIYAYDADTLSTTPLWSQNFGLPMQPNGDPAICPTWGSGPLGILSTPVIDISSQTIYFVSTNPSGSSYAFYMNALDITTGLPKFGSPVLIEASVLGTGYDNVGGVVTLNSSGLAQRPALTLANGNVYATFASCGTDVDPWHGWLLGYNASNLARQTAVFNTTANGGEGGIWQSGGGMVVDSGGNLYLSVGNGTTGYNLFGSALARVSPTGIPNDSFIPNNYADLNSYDLDLSSVGLLEIPGSNLVVASGKEGIVYLMSEYEMNPPVQSFQATTACVLGQDCYEVHSMAYWGNPANGFLYLWGAFDNLRAFRFRGSTFQPTPSSQNSLLSDNAGAGLAISANGTIAGTGIVWATNGSYYPGNSPVIAPVLRAFDALNVQHELWNSNENAARDGITGTTIGKWAIPTIANGRVFVGTYNSFDSSQFKVYVYGLIE